VSGRNLKKYQSRKLKTLDYDDDMLSHWGVQHFHLSSAVDNDGFVSRTGDFLFVHFSKNEAHILGVFNHTAWCDIDVIEKIHENWPLELSGCQSGSDSRTLTEDEYKILRRKNANASVRVKDGTEYLCPGMGVTSNGAPMFAILSSQQVIFMFNSAFDLIKENIEHILTSDPEKRISKTITIGMEIRDEASIYKVKETGFKFTLSG